MLFCADVDECSTAANNCRYKCKNLIGSFACVCPDGYTKVGSKDECVDTNECVDSRNPCENGRCVNLAGSYRCDCLDGFRASADGKRCLGIMAREIEQFKMTVELLRK